MNVIDANPQSTAETYARLNSAAAAPAAATGPAQAPEDASLFARLFGLALEADPSTDTTPEFTAKEEAQKREQELRSAAEQLVATTFIMPLFSQLRNDPMASEMFHGGRGEKVFQQQLDQILSDRISTGAGFDLVDTVTDYFAGRRGGAGQERSTLNDRAPLMPGRVPEVDLHG